MTWFPIKGIGGWGHPGFSRRKSGFPHICPMALWRRRVAVGAVAKRANLLLERAIDLVVGLVVEHQFVAVGASGHRQLADHDRDRLAVVLHLAPIPDSHTPHFLAAAIRAVPGERPARRGSCDLAVGIRLRHRGYSQSEWSDRRD